MRHRFVLFGFDTYYPCGAFGDAISTHATREEAEAAIRGLKHCYDSIDIVDLLEVAEHGL